MTDDLSKMLLGFPVVVTDRVTDGEMIVLGTPEQLFPYFYAWKNNEKRATLFGRRFRVIARGTMNSALVEFEDGQREVISRNAIRRAKNLKN